VLKELVHIEPLGFQRLRNFDNRVSLINVKNCVVAQQTTPKLERGPPYGTDGAGLPSALARPVPTCPAELSTKSSRRFPA
jgi:hypothetical protein